MVESEQDLEERVANLERHLDAICHALDDLASSLGSDDPVGAGSTYQSIISSYYELESARMQSKSDKKKRLRLPANAAPLGLRIPVGAIK